MHHRKSHTTRPLHTSRQAAPNRKSTALLPVLLVAQLMVILDITAVNIAMPSLATRPRTSRGAPISWTITSYSLVFGSLLLLGGRAADLLGRRRMFLTGLGIFTASSLGSALAGTAGSALRSPRGAGPRRSDALPGRALDHHGSSTATPGPRRSPPGARSAARAQRSASSSAECSPRSPTGG